MASRRKKSRHDEDFEAEVDERLRSLEDRVRLLEFHLRNLKRETQAAAAGRSRAEAKRAARTRPRPRCPGCTLELPKGRRGDSCVWCGFMFAAVQGPRALRR